MATRAQRKKLNEKEGDFLELNKKKLTKPDEEEEEEEEDIPQPKNTFALLSVDDSNEDKDEDSIEQENQSNEEENQPTKKELSNKAEKKTRMKMRQKQNKKNKKKEPRKENINDEEFDNIIQQYSQYSQVNKIADVKRKEVALFEVNAQFLNPENEEKKLFGAHIIKQAHQQEGRGPRGRNQQQQTRHRKTILVRPKDSWPPITSDLDMQLIDSKEGINYFKIVWSNEYKLAQQTFFQCVESGDPNTLTALLQRYPYHVDSMLQLCEACKLTNQLDMVVDLMDRILYRFETCWHTLFRPTRDTNGRLEYTHSQNRSFFIALFKYIQILDRRGCCRTSLELCKLLLNMDHSDPLGVLLLIDNYAIRSKEYSFVLDLSFSEQFEANLSILPNFAFNTALAKFLYEEEKKPTEEKGLSSTKSLLSATELLQSAIYLFPTIAPSILMKLGMNQLIVTENDQRYNIFEHPYFLNTPNLPSLPPIITIYIARNYQLWKSQNVTEWLTETLKKSFINVLNNDPMIINCQVLLEESYKEKSEKFTKHYLLSEIGDVLDLLPAQITRNGLEIYDSVEIPREYQGINPFALFLRSFLPWGDPLMGQQRPPAFITNLLAQMGLNGDPNDHNDNLPH